MEETYTFSRALHLMRYSGKKMKPIQWTSDCYVVVEGSTIFRQCDSYRDEYVAYSSEIMGSWVEVKS